MLPADLDRLVGPLRVVTADLRDEFDVLPPGDLRMALSALCDDSEWGHTWRDVLQHRFSGAGSPRSCDSSWAIALMSRLVPATSAAGCVARPVKSDKSTGSPTMTFTGRRRGQKLSLP